MCTHIHVYYYVYVCIFYITGTTTVALIAAGVAVLAVVATAILFICYYKRKRADPPNRVTVENAELESLQERFALK